jgi:predicted ATPase/DNA-binding CsgD family transcriptional regulator
MTERIGEHLGNYRLVRLLGSGGFAEVYLAEQIYLNTLAAIKVLNTQLTSDTMGNFLREARQLSHLEHQHILRVLDFGLAQERPYLVMEYAPGGTLRQRHPRGSRVPLQAILSYVTQVTTALQYAHDQGVVHGDLKPENLLLGKNEQVLLSDFGLAQLVPATNSLQVPEMYGTLIYMAPEHLRGVPSLQSDQYALAVMIYEWLSGQPPFQGAVADVVSQHLFSTPTLLREQDAEIPLAVERVVLKALSKDPTLRFVDVLSLATALREASQAEASPDRFQVQSPSTPVTGEQAATSSPVRFQNLPAVLTPLIGREQQEQAIRAFLLRPEVRLLTLTGTGGIGKTRLAQKVATDLSDTFTHGICLVQLAPISDPNLVVPTIAQTLGLRDVEERSLFSSLKAFLRDKDLLLLLDNFEPVLQAAPALVELLLACPFIKILVTSRAVLHVEGEYEFAVPPLSLPDPLHLPAHEQLLHYGAVALFVERAQAVKPTFVLSEDNAAAIAQICIRLDGLPLALELAAARSKLLPPRALLGRLNRRLAVLTGGRHDAPIRQQTLRDTISWSYDLLNAEEQRCFRRLAIFVGGCSLEAAEAVCSTAGDLSRPALDLVASLLDKSLLQQSDRGGEELRLLMLETIREYALEKLADTGELEATEQTHAMYSLTLAERGDPESFGQQQHLWVDRLTHDSENLRAALQWLLARQHQEFLLRLAGSLGWFWYMRGRLSEGMLWLEHAFRGAGQDVAVSARTKALCYEAFIALHLGLIDLHTSRAQECLALARQQRDYRYFALASWSLVHYLLTRGDVLGAREQAEETMAFVWTPGSRDEDWSLACALNALGSVLLYQGDYAQTQDVFERATDLFKKAGDLWLYGEMHLRLADVYLAQGDERKGRTLLDERVAIHAQADTSWATGWFLGLFGQIALRQGAIARARILLEAGLKRHQQLGDQQGQVLIYALLAQAAASEHDYTLTRNLAAQSLSIARTVHDSGSLILCLEELADVVAGQGEPEWAARLWGAAQRYREASNTALPQIERLGRARHIERAQRLLGEQIFAQRWAEGRNMTAEQAIAAGPTQERTSTPARPAPRRPAPTSVPPPLLDPLSQRELEVLQLVAGGASNQEIATALVVAPGTVKLHVSHILSKLGVNSRTRAILRARDLGLLTDEPPASS